MRVATLLVAQFGWEALPRRQGQTVCMIESGLRDRPTHLVTETPTGLGPALSESGAESTTEIAWKWMIIRLQNELSSITNPPDGKPIVLGPEWEFVIEKLEKDVAHSVKIASACLGGSLPHAQLQVTTTDDQKGPSLNHHLWGVLFELGTVMSSGVAIVGMELRTRMQRLLLSKLKKDGMYHDIKRSRQGNTNLDEPDVPRRVYLFLEM